MFIKIIIVAVFLMIVTSLFSALFFFYKDKGASKRTVKALTIRISLSIVLFALLMVGLYLGLITPPK
ncbi:MAG: twin transmembrane helix small protein [Gallionella sp.]